MSGRRGVMELVCTPAAASATLRDVMTPQPPEDKAVTEVQYGDADEATIEDLLTRAADGDPEAEATLQRIAEQALGEIVNQ